jgi:anthranilate synthase component I
MQIPRIQLNPKPVYRKLSEDIDFFGLFQKIEKDSQTCFFLESLGPESYHSRYSIIGFDPKGLVEGQEHSLLYDGKSYTTPNPYLALRDIMPPHALSRDYVGGLVGYISYEAMNFFEPSLNLPVDSRFPLFQFGVYTDGLVLDKMTGETFYFNFGEDRIDKVREWLDAPNVSDADYNLQIQKIGYSMDVAQHRVGVEAILEEIRSGNTFQCQLGFKTEYRVNGDLIPLYKKLRTINPSPHMYFFKFPNIRVLGASPELLFRLHNGEMESYPLAGSIKRGEDESKDVRLSRTLLNDPKEIAEHNMLVDLHRNDIGRVAKFGTVKVRKLMDIKRYSHIQHISSEVTGIIRPEEDMFSGLAASFPAGTLSGAPKIESMKIIHKIEKTPRGIYGGAIGHFGFNGNCTFAIPIRSLFVSGEYGYSQASGGIVYDSLAENEYNEIRQKSMAIEKVMETFL